MLQEQRRMRLHGRDAEALLPRRLLRSEYFSGLV
jgi:hypothetical protein